MIDQKMLELVSYKIWGRITANLEFCGELTINQGWRQMKTFLEKKDIFFLNLNSLISPTIGNISKNNILIKYTLITLA